MPVIIQRISDSVVIAIEELKTSLQYYSDTKYNKIYWICELDGSLPIIGETFTDTRTEEEKQRSQNIFESFVKDKKIKDYNTIDFVFNKIKVIRNTNWRFLTRNTFNTDNITNTTEIFFKTRAKVTGSGQIRLYDSTNNNVIITQNITVTTWNWITNQITLPVEQGSIELEAHAKVSETGNRLAISNIIVETK